MKLNSMLIGSSQNGDRLVINGTIAGINRQMSGEPITIDKDVDKLFKRRYFGIRQRYLTDRQTRRHQFLLKDRTGSFYEIIKRKY